MVATIAYDLPTVQTLPYAFQANTWTPDDQLAPDVVGLSSGGYVFAYNNNDIDNGFILLDFYDANGVSVITWRIPYDGNSDAAGAPTLTQMTNGNVVVIWDENEAGNDGLRGAIYTPVGARIGFEFVVSEELTDTAPQVAALTGGGGFVVANQFGASIVVEVFDENGDSISHELSIATTAGGNSEPVVAGLADGGFVVTWTHDNGSNLELRARMFEADGTPREVHGSTDDFLVATVGDNSQPAIAALPNGNWAIAYADSGWTDEDVGITLAIFGKNGDAIGALRHVNNPNDSNESEPDITVLDNGFIAVSWTYPIDAVQSDVYARIFDQNGNWIPVDFHDSGAQELRSTISGILAGQFVAAWEDLLSDGDGGRLSAFVKELVRTTTGDGTSETLTGDALRDTIDGGGGNDVLKGGGAKDALDGGAGSDTADYRDKTAAVVVTLNGSTDATATVGGVAEDTITYIECVYGGAAADRLSGDALANILFGFAGNDVLRGGLGADTMDGGANTDVADYLDRTASVVVTLNGATNAAVTVGGVADDTVRNIENVYGGTAADTLFGDSLANYLYGYSGNDLLCGRAGNDRLAGAAGADTFWFNAVLNAATNLDHVVDFAAEDTIRLDDVVFTALTPGALAAGAFYAAAGASAAHDADDRIVYNATTGALYCDADGNQAGGAAAVQFAVLDNHAALTNVDLVIV